jgi:undecaprenyl pyrophosphate synthase
MTKLSTKGLPYEPKVLLAWGESISQNQKITDWFMKNGFTELGLFRYALRNEKRSREWLLKNGHPHLMALINGIEGNKKALDWLKSNGFEVLHLMALTGDGDSDAHEKLMTPQTKIYALLAKKMEHIKDEIEMNNTDIHRIDPN